MDDDTEPQLAGHLCRNVALLRLACGLVQQQIGALAGVPRETIAKIAAGSPNPTLATTVRLAAALRVSLDELVAAPVSEDRLFPAGTLPARTRGGVELRPLLPHPIGGLVVIFYRGDQPHGYTNPDDVPGVACTVVVPPSGDP